MISEEQYSDYVAALLQGNTRRCAQIVGELIGQNPEVTRLYTELFQRSLYQVGDLWEENRISVAVEHLATAITERMLAKVYPTLLSDSTRNGRKAIISCTVNEYHQIGARIVADIMEAWGWDVCFLGANTPAEDMLLMIQEKQPEILGLSLSISSNMASLHRMIEIVQASYPGLDLFVGGQAFRRGGTDFGREFTNTQYVASIAALDMIIGVR